MLPKRNMEYSDRLLIVQYHTTYYFKDKLAHCYALDIPDCLHTGAVHIRLVQTVAKTKIFYDQEFNNCHYREEYICFDDQKYCELIKYIPLKKYVNY